MSQTSSSETPQIKSRIGAILRATSGNFLEQFDFFLFGFYAQDIAKAFFPAQNETAALLNAYGVFWLGALMRPVGAIVLGAYIDRIGRRQGLIVTLALMALGTVVIAFCPSYASIGIAATVIVLIGRLMQGFSAGVELGGVSVYLSEIATPGNRGFYTSFQSSSQQVAIFVAAVIGYHPERSHARPTPSWMPSAESPNGASRSLSAASSFPSFSSCGDRWRKRRLSSP